MKKFIQYLICANLILILVYLLNSFKGIHSFINVIVWIIITPIIFGIFIYYILRPLNNLFLRIGAKKKLALLLTIILSSCLLFIIGKYFSAYFIKQIFELKELVKGLKEDTYIEEFTNKYFKKDILKTNEVIKYSKYVIFNLKDFYNKGMMIFSNILLIILIAIFLLKDGEKLKKSFIKIVPNKYKKIAYTIIEEGDRVLSTYIIGQASVALALATMIFIGYKIINMPSALLLSLTTFILAFIPFLGFLISMIIPYIIAITMGLNMIIKLSVLFVIAQTLKGRIVVPFVMGRVMKIHPITDIFLVVTAATFLGPLGAFCVVPIYSLGKATIRILKENGHFTLVDKIYKV